MPAWVVQKVADALNERERSIKGSRILVLGIAYKKCRRYAQIPFG